MEDGPLETLAANPVMAAILLLAFVAILLVTVMAMSVGSQLCPAAASSTIYTSVSMSLGYAAQAFIHRQPPDAITEADHAFPPTHQALQLGGLTYQPPERFIGSLHIWFDMV